MKKNFFLAILILGFLTSLSVFADDGLTRFSIDKKVYEGLSEMQKESLVQKTQDLNNFIEINLKSKLPKNILERIKDLKIKILLTDVPGRDGLFVPKNSGEHVISVQLVQLNSNGIKALIAHEIFHAIHFHLNPDEVAWFREGMAQLFEFIVTGDFNGINLAASIMDPMTPLLGLYDVSESNPAQYGHNQMYFYYLYSHCGGPELFWKLTTGADSNGTKGSFLIDEVLASMKNSAVECKNFSESAVNFEVAKIHNQVQFQKNANGKDTFFLVSSDVSPKFTKPKSQAELKQMITSMPVLSSLKINLNDYNKFKGECSNCALFYSTNVFPYAVSEERPGKASETDVILVKLRRN